MRFFFRKKDDPYPSKQIAQHVIALSGRDYSEFETNDASIKFWIPESIEIKLDEATCLLDTSVADFVRQVLFIHLYGRYDLLGLYERKCGIYLPAREIRYSLGSLSDKPAPLVEKKIADVKIWLPSRMKSDLQTLADRAKMKLSPYVRQVLHSHLMGKLPYDPGLAGQSPPEGHDEE